MSPSKTRISSLPGSVALRRRSGKAILSQVESLYRLLKKPRGEAREKSTSGGVLSVRRSEAIERNEACGLFQQPVSVP
jgi:hypothetical protein